MKAHARSAKFLLVLVPMVMITESIASPLCVLLNQSTSRRIQLKSEIYIPPPAGKRPPESACSDQASLSLCCSKHLREGSCGVAEDRGCGSLRGRRRAEKIGEKNTQTAVPSRTRAAKVPHKGYENTSCTEALQIYRPSHAARRRKGAVSRKM